MWLSLDFKWRLRMIIHAASIVQEMQENEVRKTNPMSKKTSASWRGTFGYFRHWYRFERKAAPIKAASNAVMMAKRRFRIFMRDAA